MPEVLIAVIGITILVATSYFLGRWYARQRSRGPAPDGSAISPPPGWSDDLTSFLDLTRRQQFATFVNFRSHYDKIRDVDEVFRRLSTNLVDPEDASAPFFLLLAHAAYRAAAGLAMSTQSAPVFAVMRQCLGNARFQQLGIDQSIQTLQQGV